MKLSTPRLLKSKDSILILFVLLALVGSQALCSAAPLRRPISPEQPMWIVHIDTWNYPDPHKIIDLVPEDIRPYVVFNISLSISHNTTTGQFQVAEYGYEIARSWLRACAERQVWAFVQHASGGPAQFSDFDLTIYEEFFREYPNMLGFSYAEQFWGYDDPSDVISPRWVDRIAHFANLLELSNKYGGYLVVSWCGNQWNPHINPIGMLKRNPDFAEACRKYTENYLLFEKYTQTSYQLDMESLCLGAYLSGYSGQYGIRYDDTGWTNVDGEHEDFSMATQGAVQLEHMMLTGETMVDGPELIWTQCFREVPTASTSDGYSTRKWDIFPQFENVSVDLFRKVIDGTVRIPTREELIERTKYVVVNDVNVGDIDDIYSSPETLFEDLYSFPGNLRENMNFFKTTGRYPTIPVVFDLDDELANSFEVQINKSEYDDRWPSITDKLDELNGVFPEEYTGDIYAGRHENGWVIYNPYKTGQDASGSIPFKYNTAERIDLALGEYTAGVIKEYADRITVYLSNYDEHDASLKTDVIEIHGSSSEPTYTFVDRGDHVDSVVSKEWSNGVFTLTVQHNGPLDIEINCSGDAEDRLTDYTPAVLTAPEPPMSYEGPVQYEFEVSEYKSVSGVQRQGQNGSIRNYSGQGYVRFGTNASAGLRDAVTVRKAGEYRLEVKYSVEGGDVSSIDLYVNGEMVATPVFTETTSYSDWEWYKREVSLNEGANSIELRASSAAPRSVYFDSIVAVPRSYGHGSIVQENDSGFMSVDGTIETENSGYTGNGYANPDDSTSSGINWALDFDSLVTKSFTFRYASDSDIEAQLLVNGQPVSTRIPFPATTSLSDWDYVNVFASVPSGSAGVRLEAVSSQGLPNIDSLEVVGSSQWLEGEAPFTPLGLSASAVSISEIVLSWATTPGASSYTIKRSLSSDGPFEEIASGVSGLSYNDTGLAELTRYYYLVVGVNSEGASSNSEIESALTSTNAPPAAPSGVVVDSSSFNSVSLSWQDVPSAETYRVKRSFYSGGPYVTAGSDLTDTEFLDTGLLAGMDYYYVVTAVNENGEGGNSSEATTTTSLEASFEPIGDTYVRDGGSVDANFGNDVHLAVKDDGNVGSGFNRRSYLRFDVSDLALAKSVSLILTPYQVDNNPNLDFKLVTDDSWSESEMTWNTEATAIGELISNETGFVVGTPFEVNVTDEALAEAAGDGTLSIQISQPNSQNQFVGFNSQDSADPVLRPKLLVTLAQGVLPPQIPGEFAAEVVSETQVDLSWLQSLGADRYHVKRSETSGGPYGTLSDTVVETEYSDTDLVIGTSYYYVVSAIGDSGESENTHEVRVVPSLPISPEEYYFASMAMGVEGTLNLTIELSVVGHQYQIYTTDRLEENADWRPYGPAISGNGSPINFEIDLETIDQSRFFKLGVTR